MNNALATIPAHVSTITPSASLAFEPSDIDGAIRLANILIASRLMPEALRTPEAAFAVIMTGRELGLTTMQSIRSIHVIKGKPVMSADLMIALAKRSPECIYFRLVESTDTIATYETKRTGDTEPTRLSFTIEQARTAELMGNGTWKKFPAAMLRARCAAALCRIVYADRLLGVYETDELAPGSNVPDVDRGFDMDAEVINTPVEVAETKTAASVYLDAVFDAADKDALLVIYKNAKSDTAITPEQLAALVYASKERVAALAQVAA